MVRTPPCRITNLAVKVAHSVIVHADELELTSRSCTILLMPSGSGRSMIANALAGQLSPSVGVELLGEALFDGKTGCAISNPNWSAHAALVPQNPFHYLTELRVIDELLFSI